MNQTTELKLSLDSLLKGAVFILGGLFLAYCVLHSLFGPWWALFIARLFVSLALAGLVALAVTAAYQKLRLNKHLADARIMKARASSGFAVIQDPKGTQQVIYDHRNNSWRHYFKPGSAKLLDAMTERQPDPAPFQVEQAQELEPVLDYIGDAQSLVLIGPQGTGKTTLLSHLIDYRLNSDSCTVIDPHGHPGKYPVDAVIGAGRNYQQIDDVMTGLVEEMNQRYRNYGRGVRYQPLSIMIDEYTLLSRKCPNAKAFLESALTEFRKVGIRFVLCLHSRRAKIIGLEGAMDLADGLMYCGLKKEGGRRWAEVETEHGKVKCSLPGPYHGGGASGQWKGGGGYRDDSFTGYKKQEETPFYNAKNNQSNPCNYVNIGMNEIQNDDEDVEIITLYRQGNSFSEICRRLWGSVGGNQTKKIKAALSKHGIA